VAGLTFVNQIGAIEGMNQAAPGTLIPDTFVRWSQDVLFDRAGLMRRRGPFSKFTMYNSDGTENTDAFVESGASNERVLGVFSTYDPNGLPRVAMIVNSTAGVTTQTIMRVFDNQLKLLGEEVLFGGVVDIENLSIVSAKPALGGGLWISFAGDPASAESHYQLFWRGGAGSVTASKTGVFSVSENVQGFNGEHGVLDETITMNNVTSITKGQFVFATLSGSDYYVGTVKDINPLTNVVTLDKKPNVWDPNVDNSHSKFFSGCTATSTSTHVTVTLPSACPFIVGDSLKLTNFSKSAYNIIVTVTSVAGNTFNFALGGNAGAASGGVVRMDKDLSNLIKDAAGVDLNVSLKFTSVRPYIHNHGRGLMTIEDASTNVIISGTIGTSGEGHWKSADVAGWNVYRASDNAYVGKIETVIDNREVRTYADTGVRMAGDEYVMSPISSGINIGSTNNDMIVNNREASEFAGLYTAVYAGYQWYGNFAKEDINVNRVVFSAPHDREAVDLSKDSADSIIFPGKSQFRGLGASSAGLLVFLEDRTYILRGNDRTNFSVEQLVPDGCLCASSIVEYGGGVFWAAKAGIMFFDGASVRNLTKDNLGLYYTDSLDVFNPEQDRVMGFIHKNNLIMSYTAWKSPFDPIRYEPIYAADWQNTEGIADRTWDEFDSDFEYDDFFTQNNTPIFWDRKILNNPEESASTGLGFKWPTRYAVTNKALTSNVATLTFASHPFSVGDSIWVSGVDATFNGRYTVTAITSTTVSYAKTASNVTSVAATGKVNASNVAWKQTTSEYKWGPLRKNTSMTFCLYLPTNAITTLSNMDYRGVANIETTNGLKTIVGVNSVESNALKTRLIDIHPVFDTNTNGTDDLLVEKLNIPYTDLVLGPDFYMQTKHFTVGDPILRKWFQRIMVSMLLYDGAIRMDFVDDDDNDEVDINKKKHKYWEVFTETGYDWNYLTDIQFPKIVSPNKASWKRVEDALYSWDELFTSDFNRYSKRFAWRKASIGFRLYQMNDYKKPFNGVTTVPNRVEIQGFSVGFKPMRSGRV
jgi:hypothetical protein